MASDEYLMTKRANSFTSVSEMAESGKCCWVKETACDIVQ